MADRPDRPSLDERVWERGWEDHELRQLRRLAQLSLAEKLAWLEEAHRMVMHLAAQRKNDPSRPSAETSGDAPFEPER